MRIPLAALALVATTAAASAQASTTRIETRPYYGAITTIEHGVRVTRALPPHDRIIINPNGKTPLSLNIGAGDSGTVVQNNSSQTVVEGSGRATAVPFYGVVHPGVRRPRVHHGDRTVAPKH
jgi:hypothetical protein